MIETLIIAICLVLLETSAAGFYNQPKLCPDATWEINATTFANKTVVGAPSHGFFIDIYDRIYFPNHNQGQISVLIIGNTSFVRNLTTKLPQYACIFAEVNGDIYFESGEANGTIKKWRLNTTNSEFVTRFDERCYGLFIDINDTLYCSIRDLHHVASISLKGNTNLSSIVAGNGSAGAGPCQLDTPWGIFVDTDLKLYVADFQNNRIQLFRPGQRNGTTVAGNGIPNNLNFSHPSDVILDADGHLFIADNSNHRIIRVGINNYSCVAGCSEQRGSAPNQLNVAYSLRFDSQGNIYVADEFNDRIQKFNLATNSCETSTVVTVADDPKTSRSLTTDSQTTYYGQFNESTESANPMITSTDANKELITSKISHSNVMVETHFTVPHTSFDPPQITPLFDISKATCATLQPCQNNGTCHHNHTASEGYACSCPLDFAGTKCQSDNRPCKATTCWNNGSCEAFKNNKTFVCHCADGWHGIHCERMVNYCDNATCYNRGVCRPLFRAYKCECLGDSFYGEHCQFVVMKIQIYQIVSQTIGYVAILVLVSTVMFIVIMDILKYCFGIDPVEEERERMRREKQAKNRKPVIQRFVYVN